MAARVFGGGVSGLWCAVVCCRAASFSLLCSLMIDGVSIRIYAAPQPTAQHGKNGINSPAEFGFSALPFCRSAAKPSGGENYWLLCASRSAPLARSYPASRGRRSRARLLLHAVDVARDDAIKHAPRRGTQRGQGAAQKAPLEEGGARIVIVGSTADDATAVDAAAGLVRAPWAASLRCPRRHCCHHHRAAHFDADLRAELAETRRSTSARSARGSTRVRDTDGRAEQRGRPGVEPGRRAAAAAQCS